jgi:NTE family protein
MSQVPTHRSERVLVLQGGGALGAYQAGVFAALTEAQLEPDWVAGISIGAINSALIAGNPPERRVGRLREFWQIVSSALPAPVYSLEGIFRAPLNEASAMHSLVFGVPGFFTPRVPPPHLRLDGSIAAISYYDTAPLQRTINQLVDFDLLNAGPVRLSVGAVNVRSGNFTYFDSAKQRIDARHIMASGALPPGLPPVLVDDEYYWDGGLVSNTPLQYALEQHGERHRVVFQVDLFPARGDLPATIVDVSQREKDIRFSSRTRLNTDFELDRQLIIKAAHRLLEKLPPELREDPDAQILANLRSKCKGIDVVQLIYRTKPYESQAKDYEFSRLSMEEHWQAGYADMRDTLQDPRWTQRKPGSNIVRVFDLTRDKERLTETRHAPMRRTRPAASMEPRKGSGILKRT